MKKVKVIATVTAVLSAFVIIACQKEQSSSGFQVNQVAIPPTASVGQRVPLSVQTASSGTLARWSVSPNSGYRMDSVYSFGNNSITFTQPGSYQVSITLKNLGYRPDSIPQPPHSDSAWGHADSSYYPPTYPPYYPPVDSSWYHGDSSHYHHIDSSYHHSGDSVRFTRTIIVSR